MRITRVFVDRPLKPGMELKLPGPAASHVSRVLRLEEGAQLTLFNGHGGEYAATILHIQGPVVSVRADAHRTVERESPLHLTLVQSIARGERMDWLVQKATELGVTRIVPVFSERTVVKLDAAQAAKRVEHWRAVAIAACEQCGRNRAPEIGTPGKLAQWLESEAPGEELRLLLDPAAESSAEELSPRARAVLLVGPEGGLSAGERELARRKDFKGLRMGPRILRTETAGVAAITLLQGKLGDL